MGVPFATTPGARIYNGSPDYCIRKAYATLGINRNVPWMLTCGVVADNFVCGVFIYASATLVTLPIVTCGVVAVMGIIAGM